MKKKIIHFETSHSPYIFPSKTKQKSNQTYYCTEKRKIAKNLEKIYLSFL